MTEKTELIKEAEAKYDAYNPEEWAKIYFDWLSGGYVVASKQRIDHSKASKNEKLKYDKEIEMSIILANNGYAIELLEEISRIPSPDAKINDVLADLKRVSGHNNIVKEAKKATRKQGAKIVLFEFEKETKEIHLELLKLRKENIPLYYYFSNEKNRIYKQ